MLTTDELNAFLKDIESDRVERTISTTDTDKLSEAVCAFANDLPNHRKPGYLIIGANKDGTLSGLKVTDQLLQNLGGIRSDGNVLPSPSMSIDKYSLPEGEVAVIEVRPSELPPVRYRGQIWIRTGPRRGIANASDERILTERRTARSVTFDTTPCLQCGLDELAIDLFATYQASAVPADVIKENRRDVNEQMASLRLFNVSNNCATYAGALILSKNPLAWLPGAYVQFLRVDGESITDTIINEHRFSGNLQSMLRELDGFLSMQVQSRPEPVSFLREQQVYDYPRWALREFVMNAIMHRLYQSNAPIHLYWFNHHVEVQSPGGLYGEVTPETFPNATDYRNPVVAEAMRVLGYVFRYGHGVLAAQGALRNNGNPQAEFTFEPNYFLVTVRRRP